MRVTLSSEVPHYYHAALALQEAGILERYVCAVGLQRRVEWLYKILPEYWGKKLEGREITAVEPERVCSIWLPEILKKGLPRLRLISQQRANWLTSRLYDWMASHHVASPDIFHFVSPAGLYSARRARQRGATIICDQRSAYPDQEREVLGEEYARLRLALDPSELPADVYDKKVKAEYALADYFIVPSSFVKRTFVEAGYEPDRIFVVPYGAEVRLGPLRTSGESEKCFRIVHVGQIIPRKGLHYLVQAFEELALPDAELLLVGRVDPVMRSVVERWARSNPRIKAIGDVPHVEVGNYYRLGSVFVLPSLSDSFGLAVGEAMASGLPVVVTENTGSSELVREGLDGFIVPIRDVESLKRRIMLLYENGERRRQMGEAARSRISEFTWGRYGERLVATYEEIAARRASTK